jgi:transcriptional regulator with XRE-family HTH domain
MAGRKSTDADHRIARRVRDLRLERGISQHQLARALDVSFQQIQKYERGQNRITAGRLIDLARAFNVPIMAFYEGVPAKRSAVRALTPRDVARAAEEMRLISVFRGITSAAGRKKVLAFARAVAAG